MQHAFRRDLLIIAIGPGMIIGPQDIGGEGIVDLPARRIAFRILGMEMMRRASR
jgi:hypothetical protein